MAIMLDHWFKNMKVIWDFLGHAHAIQIVIDYGFSIVCPLFYIIGVFSFEPY
jgi:hypothetical protein